MSSDRSVLITGASTGFGAEVSLLLARRGWRVFASMRDPDKATALLERAERVAVRERIAVVALDVADSGSIAAAVAQVLDATGGTLDVLLNNAGYSVLGAFEDIGEEDCRAQMETNFFGPLAVTRAVLPAMRKQGSGRIVTITSNAVNAPHPLLTMYAASKWALEGWAEGLAMEVAPFGIEVGVIEPGAHRTPFATNVHFVAPEGSAYSRWIAQTMPGISNLDKWGREPALASRAIADAIEAEDLPFRTLVGEDTRVFAALKASAPYETRAFVLRAITGAPAPGEYMPSGATPSGEEWPVVKEVSALVADALAADPLAAAEVARAFRLQAG